MNQKNNNSSSSYKQFKDPVSPLVNLVLSHYLVQDRRGDFVDFHSEKIIFSPVDAVYPFIFSFDDDLFALSKNDKDIVSLNKNKVVFSHERRLNQNFFYFRGLPIFQSADYKSFFPFNSDDIFVEFDFPVHGDVNLVGGSFLVKGIKDNSFYDLASGKLFKSFKTQTHFVVNRVDDSYVLLDRDSRRFIDFYSEEKVFDFPFSVNGRIQCVNGFNLVKRLKSGAFYDLSSSELVVDFPPLDENFKIFSIYNKAVVFSSNNSRVYLFDSHK